MADDTPGRQNHRVLVVHVLRRTHIGGQVEACLAIWKVERPSALRHGVPGSRLEQARRPLGPWLGHALRHLAWTWPEHAEIFFHSLVGDPGVVGDAALG